MNKQLNTGLYGISALYCYFNIKQKHFLFRLIEGSIVDIAKTEEHISYPGIDGVDALCLCDNCEVLYSCFDSIDAVPTHPLSVMNLLAEQERRCFKDPVGCYPDLRGLKLCLASGHAGRLSFLNLLEAAAIVSAFGFSPDDEFRTALEELVDSEPSEPPVLLQRMYLTAILTGDNPAAGLKLLKDYGFIERFWPELWALVGLSHSKEYHPEGDVWEHTLETLYHRKTADLDISLALLLHDTGKPEAEEVDGNKFNRHAQIGRRAAASFLWRLEFDNNKIEKICFLVENHMLPAAITRLPAFRSERALSSPYFPVLLEVYRCDLLLSRVIIFPTQGNQKSHPLPVC